MNFHPVTWTVLFHSELIDLFVVLQNEKRKAFVAASNARIQQYETELESIKNTRPYGEMTDEEFAYVHPELSYDPLTCPGYAPHTEEIQLDEEDLAFYRKSGLISYPGPDTFLDKRHRM